MPEKGALTACRRQGTQATGNWREGQDLEGKGVNGSSKSGQVCRKRKRQKKGCGGTSKGMGLGSAQSSEGIRRLQTEGAPVAGSTLSI